LSRQKLIYAPLKEWNKKGIWRGFPIGIAQENFEKRAGQPCWHGSRYDSESIGAIP
jgi:hypothetical protein